MEELFAIAVSFGKIVRTRGFSRVLKNPKLFNASHATFSHAFCLVFVFTRDARKERTHKRAKRTTRRLMSRQVGFNLESISLSSSSSSSEEEEEDACVFEARKKEDIPETRKVLRYDAEDVATTTKNNHHLFPFASSNKGESGILLDAHERNVREVLRKAICVDEEEEYSSDFEDKEEKRTEEATKEDREKEEEKEDFNAAPASTTTTTTTATFLGPKPPPRRFQSAFDIARKALRREEHFLSATTTTQTTSTDATLVVDAHAFGGKAFRGSWAGTSGRFAFCDGSKIVERAVVPVEDFCGLEGEEDGLDEEEAKRAMMTFQARAIKNGLKCFEAFSEKEVDPRCRLNVPAEDVKEFCRVHCEALANALMLLNNSGDGSNSNSNADDEYGCKTRRRQRIASKTKRAIELWDLLELLYKKDELGAQRGSAADTFRRKQSLSKWLKRSLKRAEMEKALEMDAQPMDFDDDDDDDDNNNDKKEKNNDPVSVALSRNDIVLATQLALNDGDMRLATIIAQTGASDNIKNLANAQLNTWENAFGTATNKYIPAATRSVMELLAGRVETTSSEDGTSRNATPETKDWIENLSRRVWFHHNVAETTEKILERYERDILEGKNGILKDSAAALFPHPSGVSQDALVEHKCEGIVKDARYDALLLTSLTSASSSATAAGGARNTSSSNGHPFHQLGFGEDFLEFSNSWMATQFVLSQQSSSKESASLLSRRGDQYTENLIGQISQLNAYFASEDEKNNEENRLPKIECDWLLFVALFIRDDSKRERACKRILTETVTEWRKSAVKLDILARKFQMPKKWLDDANEAKMNNDKPVLTNSLYR